MDVNKVENSLIYSALPTTAVAAGAGIVGYMTPKMVDKSGNLDPFFHAYNASNLLKSDIVQLSDAAYLRSIKKEIAELNREPDKLSEAFKAKQQNVNNKLENFVTERAEELKIKPKDGQRLKDAVEEFLKDKDVATIEKMILSKSEKKNIKRRMRGNKYIGMVKNTFNEVFDASTKKFKEGADKETVEFFKKSLRNLKMQNAKTYAYVGGGFAFIGALVANLLHSDKNS